MRKDRRVSMGEENGSGCARNDAHCGGDDEMGNAILLAALGLCGVFLAWKLWQLRTHHAHPPVEITPPQKADQVVERTQVTMDRLQRELELLRTGPPPGSRSVPPKQERRHGWF